jgi:hypothetical protein
MVIAGREDLLTGIKMNRGNFEGCRNSVRMSSTQPLGADWFECMPVAFNIIQPQCGVWGVAQATPREATKAETFLTMRA